MAVSPDSDAMSASVKTWLTRPMPRCTCTPVASYDAMPALSWPPASWAAGEPRARLLARGSGESARRGHTKIHAARTVIQRVQREKRRARGGLLHRFLARAGSAFGARGRLRQKGGKHAAFAAREAGRGREREWRRGGAAHPLDKDTRATHWRGLWSSSSTSSASALRVGQALPHGIPAGLCERSLLRAHSGVCLPNFFAKFCDFRL